MPKQVYLEEVIDHVVSLCQFHLENTIYPEFDPTYKVASENKGIFLFSSLLSTIVIVFDFITMLQISVCRFHRLPSKIKRDRATP